MLTEAMLREAARRTWAASPACRAAVKFGSRARGDARPDFGSFKFCPMLPVRTFRSSAWKNFA